MSKLLPYYYYILGFLLTVGCLFHPVSSAIGLLIVFLSKHGEAFHAQYTKSLSDKASQDFDTLRADLSKLKAKVDQDSLSKAFGQR